MRPYRNRTVPHKILSAIMYGNLSCIKLVEYGRVKLDSGPLARSLCISNSRLIEAIEWLKATEIFEKVDYPLRGTIIVSLKVPNIFNPEGETKLGSEGIVGE